MIKADGLAAGKGVIVAMTHTEAENAIKDMLAGNAFGDAGHRIVIEEFLDGEEASFIVMVDGENVLPMATSQDHKRVVIVTQAQTPAEWELILQHRLLLLKSTSKSWITSFIQLSKAWLPKDIAIKVFFMQA